MKRLKEGGKAIWRPKDWDGEKWADDGNHPWYGHTVTILYAPPDGASYQVYQFHVDDAPNVNDKHAFDFWDVAERLEPV